MFREGEDKELLDGLKNTENSFERFQDTFGWTTYEYITKTDANKEAGKLGIKNFKENITLVMLFCPEINLLYSHYLFYNIRYYYNLREMDKKRLIALNLMIMEKYSLLSILTVYVISQKKVINENLP